MAGTGFIRTLTNGEKEHSCSQIPQLACPSQVRGNQSRVQAHRNGRNQVLCLVLLFYTGSRREGTRKVLLWRSLGSFAAQEAAQLLKVGFD